VKFCYDVTLLNEQTGTTMTYRLTTGWTREKDYVTDESIGRTAAAQAWYEHGKKVTFAPVSVVEVPMKAELLH
jgi:hypothetical protein